MSLVQFFSDRLEIARNLSEEGELSLLNTFNTDLPRIFVVASASHFEAAVTGHIREFFAEVSESHPALLEFVARKALFRNYHTLFDWDERTANKFFILFGKPCSDHYKQLVRSQDWLAESAVAFLRLGQERNKLMHGDFATHSPTLTAPEVQQTFAAAQRFVDAIPLVLRLQDLGET